MSLRIQALTHRFGQQAALTDVSLHVRSGDCYGFIGHNGAGKTTAMRAVLGLLRPQAGRIVVDGFDAARHPREARARIGALIETPGFHGHWGARHNLMVLGRLAGMPRREARTEAGRVLELVDLADVAHKPVRTFSQGMRQRLGIAQALLGSPAYLLLDEPTNGLDPEGVAEIRELLLQLNRQDGTTILISSHQLHELNDLCNRVGVLRDGKLLVEEELSTLLRAQESLYVVRTDRDDTAMRRLEALSLRPETRVTGGLLVDLGSQRPGPVVRSLVESGLNVEVFAPRPPSLEEVYLKFTREGCAATVAMDEPVGVKPPTERRAPGRPVWRMVRYEAARWTRLTVPGLLALPPLMDILAVVLRRQEARAEAARVLSGEIASTTDVTAFEGVAVALSTAGALLPYVLLGLASQSISGEFSQGTLRNVLLRPLRRLQVLAGKQIALLGAALFAYLLVAGTAMAAAAWAFDFTDLNEMLDNGKLFPLVKASELWAELGRALVSPLLPLCVYVAIGLLAGTVARRGATGLALALGLGVFLDVGRALARSFGLEAWTPAAYVPSPLARGSYLDYYLDVSRGYSNATFELGATQYLVPCVWLVACFALAYAIFQRRFVP